MREKGVNKITRSRTTSVISLYALTAAVWNGSTETQELLFLKIKRVCIHLFLPIDLGHVAETGAKSQASPHYRPPLAPSFSLPFSTETHHFYYHHQSNALLETEYWPVKKGEPWVWDTHSNGSELTSRIQIWNFQIGYKMAADGHYETSIAAGPPDGAPPHRIDAGDCGWT